MRYYNFAVYITACDLVKSFTFKTSVKIMGHVSFQIHILANTCYIFWSMRFTKLSNTWSDVHDHSSSM